MTEEAKEEVLQAEDPKKAAVRKPGRPKGISQQDRAELEEFRMEKRQRAIAAEREAREEARREAEKERQQAKREATKVYINVTRGRLYTGVTEFEIDGKKVKTMGILYPRDWVGDVLPRHGSKEMELTRAQANGFGEKLVSVS